MGNCNKLFYIRVAFLGYLPSLLSAFKGGLRVAAAGTDQK